MLIILFLFFMLTAKAEEEIKLIDLLPEEEKQLFLERIARRIHEEVQVDPVKQKSVEVPDNELEIHDAFVRKILKEEQANLRKDNLNEKGDLSVSLNSLSNKKDKKIDITLSRNKRQTNKTKHNSDSDSKNDNVQSVDKPESSIKSDDEDIEIQNYKLKSKVDENTNVTIENVLITTDKATVDAPTEHQDNATTESIITSNLNNSYEPNNSKRRNNEENPNLLTASRLEAINNQSLAQNNESIEKQANLSKPEKTTTVHDQNEIKHDLGTGNKTFLDIPVPNKRVKDSKRNVKGETASSTVNPVSIVNEVTTVKSDKIEADNFENVTEAKIIPANSNNTNNPELSVKVDSKTKEHSSNNNSEIVSTNLDKIGHNVEKGETITEQIKNELQAEEKNKNDVSEVTEKKESNKNVKGSETGKQTIKVNRINTENFGAPEPSVKLVSKTKEYSSNNNSEIVSINPDKIGHNVEVGETITKSIKSKPEAEGKNKNVGSKVTEIMKSNNEVKASETSKHTIKVNKINTENFGAPETSVKLVSKTKEYSSNNNSEIVSTNPEKIDHNVEKGEIVTESIQSKSEAEEKNKNDVSEVTERKQSNNEVKVSETDKHTMEVNRINTGNFGAPEPNVKLVSKTKEHSSNINSEIVSRIPEKIGHNLEKGETITESIKSEPDAENKNKHDVSEVTETKKSKKEVSDTDKQIVKISESKVIRINTINFGDIVDSNAHSQLQTKENVKEVSRETDSIKEVKGKLSITEKVISVKTNRINTFNFGDTAETKNKTANTNGTNSNLFINLDIALNVKNDLKTLRPKKHDSNKNSEKEYKLEVTTQKIEVLTPLTPLTEKYNMQAIDNEEKYTVDTDNHIIRVLRDVIKQNTAKNVNANEKFDEFIPVIKVKEHEVYKVPKGEKILYLDNAVNEENPYYYPTFNYSPDNAYYNAHNNYGPTNDQELERDNGGDQGREHFINDDFNDNNPRYGYLDDLAHTNDNDPLIANFLLNPHLVPYVTRTEDDVSENKDNSEEKGLKRSLNQIRMMMFAHKNFGPVNEDNRTYSPIGVDSTENTTDKNNLRVDFEAIIEGVKKQQETIITDDNNILEDYLVGLKHKSNNNKINKNQHWNTVNPTLKDVNDRDSNKHDFSIYVISPEILKPIVNTRYTARAKKDKDKNNTSLEKIQKVLKMSNAEDLMPNLNTLLKMNLTRSGAKASDVDIYADVLSDLIQTDNRALVQFDWLGSTVDILGAIMKLIELTDSVQHDNYIHPSDIELLKYTTYLHKKASIAKHYYNKKLRMRVKTPKGKKKKSKLIKTNGLIDRVYLFRQSINKEEKRLTKRDVINFGEFLKGLLNALYNLHTAIREISSITRYNNQHWFRDLKELYLDGTRNTTLPLLLHLKTKRVLDLVEKSTKNGLELNVLKYIQRNKNEVRKSKTEFVFILEILEKISQ